MGVTFDLNEQRFVFDFEHDGKNDIITLTGNGYQVEAFGKCFYYGYEFTDDVDGSLRSEFIKYVKFTGQLKEHAELTHFIQKAVNELNQKINLYNYDLVVMPESQVKSTNIFCVTSTVSPNHLCMALNWLRPYRKLETKNYAPPFVNRMF